MKKEKTTYHYNEALTSKNFAKATNKLEPGKTYKVKIFPIIPAISSEDCVAFLRNQNAILAGVLTTALFAFTTYQLVLRHFVT